jgi:hypothetical protein
MLFFQYVINDLVIVHPYSVLTFLDSPESDEESWEG